MRAVLVQPPKAGVRLGDAPTPAPGPDEVRVRVLECGICGTDRDIVAGKYGVAPAGRSDLVLGHENLGAVDQVGAAITGFRVGDLVVATVRRGCGLCRFCLAFKSDFCETGRYTERGIVGRDGYLADFYVERPEYLVRVPRPHLRTAVLLEPLSVVEKAIVEGRRVLDRVEPTSSHAATRPRRALVTGTGAVGMLASLVLALEGFDVTAIDRHGDDTPAARILSSIAVRHVDVSDGLASLGDLRFDLILEASGSATLDFELVARLGPNAALVLTGLPSAAPPSLPVDAAQLFRGIVLQNQALVGSVNANRSFFEAGLRHLTGFRRRWGAVPEQLITLRASVERFAEVLEGKRPDSIKTVLTLAT